MYMIVYTNLSGFSFLLDSTLLLTASLLELADSTLLLIVTGALPLLVTGARSSLLLSTSILLLLSCSLAPDLYTDILGGGPRGLGTRLSGDRRCRWSRTWIGGPHKDLMSLDDGREGMWSDTSPLLGLESREGLGGGGGDEECRRGPRRGG